jgi:hypothetical protein
MIASRLRITLALVLVLTIAVGPTMALTDADEKAEFSGRVFHADGVTPRSGAVIVLFDDEADLEYRSQATDKEGAFTIDTAPPGNYALIVETAEGAYLASDALELTVGTNKPLSLALKSAGARPVAGGSGMSNAAKGGIAAAIFVGAALIINDLTSDDDEQPATAF